MSWEALKKEVAMCNQCELYRKRNLTVFGDGDTASGIMFVGEGPGREEDLQGHPFVGAAGQLFEKMLASIALEREEVYIANVVKCRPPNNRNPNDNEIQSCLPFLHQQLNLIKPKILVCLGAVAGKQLYSTDLKITRQRGQWIKKNDTWILPSYHPAALLRDENKKSDAWLDMQSIRQKYKELCPEKC